MAEKTAAKKRPPRQQMLDTLAETERAVSERREAQARPEEKVEAKVAAQAVAIADEAFHRGRREVHQRVEVRRRAGAQRVVRPAGGTGFGLRAGRAGDGGRGAGA